MQFYMNFKLHDLTVRIGNFGNQIGDQNQFCVTTYFGTYPNCSFLQFIKAHPPKILKNTDQLLK